MTSVYFLFLAAVLTTLVRCSDIVNEQLYMQPLKNGDWLVVIDVDITSTDYDAFIHNLSYPGVHMDLMSPDIAKLYVKTQAEWFEGSIGFGSWKQTLWGNNRFPIIPNGITLMAKWVDGTIENRHDMFSTLCHGLWGITGTPFINMLDKDAYIYNMSDLLNIEDQKSVRDTSVRLFSTAHDASVCVDNLYKWRILMPCISRMGLISIINDERLFVNASYNSISFIVEGDHKTLTFTSRVQFVVNQNKIKSIWDLFPNKVCPKPCPSVTNSAIEFVVPKMYQSHFTLNTVYDIQSKDINKAFNLLKLLKKEMFETNDNQLNYEFAELDSMLFPIIKRVQSSLLIDIENLSNQTKCIRAVQPLLYWAVPQIHTMQIRVEQKQAGDGSVKLLYSCQSSDCFKHNKMEKNVDIIRSLIYGIIQKGYTNMELKYRGGAISSPAKSTQTELFTSEECIETADHLPNYKKPFIIYTKMFRWYTIGMCIELPPNTRIVFRIEIQKNNILVEDLDTSFHRGQLIPSGVIVDSTKLDGRDIFKKRTMKYNNYGYLYTTGPIFSYIIYPDTTMTFNVLAASGILVGMLFGICFNILLFDWIKDIKVL